MVNQSCKDRFLSIAHTLQGQVSIFVSQVDPDALGSAMGLDYILERVRGEAHVPSQIIYGGSIGHPQNRAIINRFNLQKYLVQVSTANLAKSLPTALVDSSVIEDVRLPLIAEYPPKITIDHHRGSTIFGNGETFVLIEDVGAASTLVHELMEVCEVEIGPVDRHIKILMALGIHTDTKGLLGAHQRDLAAYQKLVCGVSAEELAPFVNYRVGPQYFDYFKRALDCREQQGSRLIAGLGFMDPSDGDQLATVADDFLRQDGVSLVVVWGIIGNKVRVSARCSDISTPLDDFLKKRFTAKAGAKLTPDGRGEGGALLELDLGIWREDSTESIILKLVEAWMSHHMFTV